MISVVVTTYDAPAQLEVCLSSLLRQTDTNFEIIVAEDGLFESTHALLARLQSISSIPIKHVAQEDKGFRAARLRNLAINASCGDYIIFTDGDCFMLPDFIAQHRRLAAKGAFLSGKRSYLGTFLTRLCLKKRQPLFSGRLPWFFAALLGQCTRLVQFVVLPDGAWRWNKADSWQQVQTCNLGVWREDIGKINGFDNRYEGHGLEDSDFVLRLLKTGIKRKRGDYGCLVLHLEHPRRHRPPTSCNATLFDKTIAQKTTQTPNGLTETAA